MECAAPEDTPGGLFTCSGYTTGFGDTCDLICDSSKGYEGDTQITCNIDNNDGTVSWSSTPTCASKHIFGRQSNILL